MALKNIFILGSTGSIGINTLRVVDRLKGHFNVLGLSAYSNSKLLEQQIKKYSPKFVAANDKSLCYLKKCFSKRKVEFFDVESELSGVISHKSVDIVVIGMSGGGALDPFLSAVRSGKTVAPANKEALVIAGELIMREAKKFKATVIPVDSEQSAIFQCLNGQKRSCLKQIYLTASGGSLANVSKSRFDKLSVDQILAHPRWKMGKKITVDSATLMNKGFEVIEAKNLFGLDIDQIKVLIHPEAIIHSMVEYCDGSILAQLGVTDMRIPIQYALTYPHRYPTGLKQCDFAKLKSLTFRDPDFKKFPPLALSYYAAKRGGSLPCVLNAADEELVNVFLQGKLKLTGIFKFLEKIVSKHKNINKPSLKQLKIVDLWTRQEIKKYLG